MDELKKIFLSGFLIILLIGGLGYMSLRCHNSACKDLGYNKYNFNSDIATCEDYQGDLHYVKISCSAFYLDCSAKEITIGKVEVKR